MRLVTKQVHVRASGGRWGVSEIPDWKTFDANYVGRLYREIERLQSQLTAICDGVNRRCGRDTNQLPLVSVDRKLAELNAEIERLRAALQAIVDDDVDDTAVAIAAKALGLKVFVGNSPNEDIKRAAGGE